MKTVYMDNNATTCVAPEVRDAMLPFFDEYWGNPSSMHNFGGQVKKYIERAREQVAAFINADPSEIVFTSCGSESNNTAIRGAVESMGSWTRLITTRVEHHATLAPCHYLEDRGHPVIELDVDGEGALDMDELRKALAYRNAVVSIMWANNETGVLFPIQEIAETVKNAGAVIHTDAIQAVGKIPIDVSKTPVDMLSISGHKIHAPKGVGALYIRRGTKLNPLMLGGHQENGKRAGTENVPYIVGLGVACELAAKHLDDYNTRVRAMRDRLEKGLAESCPDTKINGNRENRVPNTTNIGFEYIEGEAILLLFDQVGIAASSGSACTSGALEPSHVLRAMGVPHTAVQGSIRFSLSRFNTDEDIDYTLEQVPPIIERLRQMSPFVKS